MSAILSVIISALLQIALFSLVPFIVWFIWQRKKVSFPEYVGLKKPKRTASWWIVLLVFGSYIAIDVFVPHLFPDSTLQTMQGDPSVASNRYIGLGVTAILPVFISTFIQNGFCEELVFRGFLCKRLIKWLGKPAGIIIQACIFAVIHNILFLNIAPDSFFQVLLFGFIAVQATLMAIINEELFGGSIWPSVLIHGIGNFLTTMLVVF